jgi:hypothetical protein
MSKQINNLSTPRHSISSGASSAENTPRRTRLSISCRKRKRNFFEPDECSEPENVLEQTMCGIDDSNQIEPFMENLTQVCEFLSSSWGANENDMTKIAYRAFGNFSIDDGVAENVIDKRKSEEAAETCADNPSKKFYLDNAANESWSGSVPVTSPVSVKVDDEEIFSVYKDSLTDEFEFTQLKKLTAGQISRDTVTNALQPVDMNRMVGDTQGPVITIKPFLPLATIVEKPVENFVGFKSARGGKIACNQVKRNIFEGIDDEVEKEFGIDRLTEKTNKGKFY